MQPLISVIVPVFKVEKYIEKCINGIRNQTYRNLEIILVDDGSPDESGHICDALAKQDDRIKVIHKENGGAATARNAGLDAMTGAYIAFVDADDYMEPSYIGTLYQLIEDHDAEAAICGFTTVDENGTAMTIDTLHASQEDSISGIQIRTGSDIILQDLQGHWEHVAPWGKLFRADQYQGIRYPAWFAHEDEPVFVQVFDRIKKVAITEEKLYYYVQHSGSLMNTAYSEKDRATYLAMWRERLEYYQDGSQAHAMLLGRVRQAYVAWNVLYLSLHADQMTKQQQKEMKHELRKHFWSLFQKPFLFDFSYSCKMAVKCILTLINTNILRKRYI
jgi:glycosyltransferase involved in cell wall biosynthesis